MGDADIEIFLWNKTQLVENRPKRCLIPLKCVIAGQPYK